MIALRDQPYGTGKIADQTHDFFRPDNEEIVPLVVFIHGGGWISGDKTMYRDEAVWLAGQGYAAACLSYRLAPLYPFPKAVADVQAFVRWARDRSHELGCDPTQIVLMGNSAGGHLACMAALCSTDFETGELAELPNAVVSLCAITDLRNYEQTHFPIAFSFVEQFMGGPERDLEATYAVASPVAQISESAPPFVIVHGTEDEIVPIDQARALYSGLCSVGTAAELHEMTGEGHVFSYAAWERVRELLLELLDTL